MTAITAAAYTATAVSNYVIEDARLSERAVGLWIRVAYLLDAGAISVEHLADLSPRGHTSIESGLKELEAAGYLERIRHHGIHAGSEWRLHNVPNQEAP